MEDLRDLNAAIERNSAKLGIRGMRLRKESLEGSGPSCQCDWRTACTQQEGVVAALVAEGTLLPLTNLGPFKPFKPVRVKGTPVSRLIY